MCRSQRSQLPLLVEEALVVQSKTRWPAQLSPTWGLFSRRLRMWLLLAIALPLIQTLTNRLALPAERRDPSTRTEILLQADSAVGAVSLRAARRQTRRRERRRAAR
jgi:hypothetical protein